MFLHAKTVLLLPLVNIACAFWIAYASQ